MGRNGNTSCLTSPSLVWLPTFPHARDGHIHASKRSQCSKHWACFHIYIF
jgi:hypothetical protein